MRCCQGNCSGGAIVVMAVGSNGAGAWQSWWCSCQQASVACHPARPPSLHAPGMMLCWSSSLSIMAFCSAGAWSLRRLWMHRQARDDGLHCGRHLCHSTQKTPESVGKNAKGILHTSPGSGKSIVKYPLLHGQWAWHQKVSSGWCVVQMPRHQSRSKGCPRSS